MHRRLRPALRTALPVALAGIVAGLAAACGPAGSDPLASFGGASLTIQARDLAFDPDIATAPAGVALRLVLDNKDAGVPHNLHVFQGATDLGSSPTVAGPGLAAIVLPALAPGRYQFACTIHQDMIGTILVETGGQAGPSDTADTPPPDTTDPPLDAPSGS